MSLIFDGHDFGALFEYGDPEYKLLSSNVHQISSDSRNGNVVIGKTWGAASLTLRLYINGTMEQRRERLSELGRWLNVDEPKQLVVPDFPGCYFLAIPDGEVSTLRGFDGEVASLTFSIVDPIAYGEEKSITVPSGGSISFNVGGTFRARPTITADAVRNASSQVWGLRLDEGKYINIATGNASARAVSIDCEERVSTVAGSVVLPTIDSDWLEFQPGEHTLRMENGTGAATVTWRERWL